MNGWRGERLLIALMFQTWGLGTGCRCLFIGLGALVGWPRARGGRRGSLYFSKVSSGLESCLRVLGVLHGPVVSTCCIVLLHREGHSSMATLLFTLLGKVAPPDSDVTTWSRLGSEQGVEKGDLNEHAALDLLHRVYICKC